MPRNNFSKMFIHIYLHRYMFRPLLVILRQDIQLLETTHARTHTEANNNRILKTDSHICTWHPKETDEYRTLLSRHQQTTEAACLTYGQRKHFYM
jgi:hypothetical protein